MPPIVVIDTNVFVAALRSHGGAAREVVRRCIAGRYRPIMGNALWLEYEDVLGREALWSADTTPQDRQAVLAAFAGQSRWISIRFAWRPNLPDEGDNHLIELAVASAAHAVVTHNVRDLARGELLWRELRVLTPAQCLEAYP